MITAGIVAVFAIYLGYRFLALSGAMSSFENTLVEQCKRVDVAPGTEDVQYDADTSLVFISASERREAASSERARPASNGIYALDVSANQLDKIGAPFKVSPAELADFQPHGLSLWRDAERETASSSSTIQKRTARLSKFLRSVMADFSSMLRAFRFQRCPRQ